MFSELHAMKTRESVQVILQVDLNIRDFVTRFYNGLWILRFNNTFFYIFKT